MVKVVKGDITTMEVDAVVAPAKNSLKADTGVDKAIHDAAGPELEEKLAQIGRIESGDAKLTEGYNLPAKYIIHTVGPVWRSGSHGEAKLLESCYQKCMEIALQKNLRSIAFPPISTGPFGFPKSNAASIAVKTVNAFLKRFPGLEVDFVCDDDENYHIYRTTTSGGGGLGF
jgi:O-acetyl-ADP-ribose deacetylase